MNNNTLGALQAAGRQRANVTLFPVVQLAPEFDVYQQLTTRRKPWTVSELANVTGFAMQTLYKHVAMGKLPACKLGGSIRVPQQNALAWYNGLATA